MLAILGILAIASIVFIEVIVPMFISWLVTK